MVGYGGCIMVHISYLCIIYIYSYQYSISYPLGTVDDWSPQLSNPPGIVIGIMKQATKESCQLQDSTWSHSWGFHLKDHRALQVAHSASSTNSLLTECISALVGSAANRIIRISPIFVSNICWTKTWSPGVWTHDSQCQQLPTSAKQIGHWTESAVPNPDVMLDTFREVLSFQAGWAKHWTIP